jgi:hypothetical protein
MARRFAWRERGRRDSGELTVSTRCRNKLCVRHPHLKSRAEIMAGIIRPQYPRNLFQLALSMDVTSSTAVNKQGR